MKTFTKQEFDQHLSNICLKHSFNYNKIATETICRTLTCCNCEMFNNLDDDHCIRYAKSFVITKIRQHKLEKLLV